MVKRYNDQTRYGAKEIRNTISFFLSLFGWTVYIFTLALRENRTLRRSHYSSKTITKRVIRNTRHRHVQRGGYIYKFNNRP